MTDKQTAATKTTVNQGGTYPVSITSIKEIKPKRRAPVQTRATTVQNPTQSSRHIPAMNNRAVPRSQNTAPHSTRGARGGTNATARPHNANSTARASVNVPRGFNYFGHNKPSRAATGRAQQSMKQNQNRSTEPKQPKEDKQVKTKEDVNGVKPKKDKKNKKKK
jgi:hypothetical protein